jgi:hypothetical protein
MLKQCIFCDQPFPSNDEVESFPLGRRIAFDPARGRLWSVCDQCQHWTLAPFEQRWEALEQLEQITRDRAHLLVQGENIGLLSVGAVELIRVGAAPLRVEAWWRYGRELTRRHEHARRVIRWGKFKDVLFSVAILGVPMWSKGAKWLQKDWRQKFGKFAWTGSTNCNRCGKPISELEYVHAFHVRVLQQGDQLALSIPCAACAAHDAATLSGRAATTTARRVLAYRNYAGASDSEVNHAVEVVERAGSPAQLLATLQPLRLTLAELGRSDALGLEIALNDEVERRELTGEVRGLEADWRNAEEVAKIADRELT